MILNFTAACVSFALGVFSPDSLFEVKQIRCPNSCRGERTYQLTYYAGEGVRVESDRGVISNDTIFDIDPRTDYRLTLRITHPDGQHEIRIVPLPQCEPILPSTPLVAIEGSASCQNPPRWSALSTAQVMIEWYSTTSGERLSEERVFVPPVPGTYYAVARDPQTACRSVSQANVTWMPEKKLCPVLSVRKFAQKK